MSPAPLGLSAALVYLLATARLALPIVRDRGLDPGAKPQALGLGALAALLHAGMLYQVVLSGPGLNLAFFNALSLFAWVGLLR